MVHAYFATVLYLNLLCCINCVCLVGCGDNVRLWSVLSTFMPIGLYNTQKSKLKQSGRHSEDGDLKPKPGDT